MHHSEMQHSSGGEALGQSAGGLTQHPTLSLDATHLLQESSTQTVLGPACAKVHCLRIIADHSA